MQGRVIRVRGDGLERAPQLPRAPLDVGGGGGESSDADPLACRLDPHHDALHPIGPRRPRGAPTAAGHPASQALDQRRGGALHGGIEPGQDRRELGGVDLGFARRSEPAPQAAQRAAGAADGAVVAVAGPQGEFLGEAAGGDARIVHGLGVVAVGDAPRRRDEPVEALRQPGADGRDGIVHGVRLRRRGSRRVRGGGGRGRAGRARTARPRSPRPGASRPASRTRTRGRGGRAPR